MARTASDAWLEALTLEHAFRQLDERFRVYQYVIKQPPAPLAPEWHAHPLVDEALTRRIDDLNAKIETLFELDLYLVILYESDFGASRTATLAHCLQQPRVSRSASTEDRRCPFVATSARRFLLLDGTIAAGRHCVRCCVPMQVQEFCGS